MLSDCIKGEAAARCRSRAFGDQPSRRMQMLARFDQRSECKSAQLAALVARYSIGYHGGLHRRVGARAAHAVADGLLGEFGLEAIARREVGVLAHGERQWVEIGMVVAQRPKLILLDEPTAGMAADEVKRTADLLRAVNINASLVVVEHDMQFIKMIGSIVTVLHQGRILIEDAMENVLNSRIVREVYLGSGYARG